MDHIVTLWRSSRGCCLISAVIALLLILGSCAAIGFGLARLTEAAEPSGLDVMLVIDQSGSLWELEGVGTDPTLTRMEAARLFASTLGVDGPLADYRLGVIYFGSTPTLVAPLTSLTRSADGRAAVLDALSAPPQPLGWTDVNAALALAYDHLVDGPNAHPNHARALVLFTDGRPQTADVTTPTADDASLAELRQWIERFASHQTTVVTVLLGNPITDADPQMNAVYRPFWTGLAHNGLAVRFYDVQAGDDLLDVYHEVAAHLQDSQSQGAIVDQAVQGDALLPIDIPAGWAQATFVARKSTPDLALTLLRPDGSSVQPGDPDVRQPGAPGERVEVWAIRQPQAGRWTLRAAGEGIVTLWLDFRPLPATPTPTHTATPAPATSTSTPTAAATRLPTATPTASPTWAAAILVAPAIDGEAPQAPEAPGRAPWGWIAFAGAAVVTAGGLGAAARRRRQPALEGKLRTLRTPEGERAGKAWDLGEQRRPTAGLGRGADQTVMLPGDPTLLPKTALIRTDRDSDGKIAPLLVDLSGAGMVQVKGRPRADRYTLADGDVIEIGAYQLRYENVNLRRQAQPWRPPTERRSAGGQM